MLLKTFTIRDFQSIRDSNPIDVSDITCLVGKNEAGKTAILRALYRLNPIDAADNVFDVTDDYPRSRVTEYERRRKAGETASDVVTEATFTLEAEELAPIEARFGTGVIPDGTVTLRRGYDNATRYALAVDETIAGKRLLETAGVADRVRSAHLTWHSLKELATALESRSLAHEPLTATQGATEQVKGSRTRGAPTTEEPAEDDGFRAVETQLAAIAAREGGLAAYIAEEYLAEHVPVFMYFDDYYQMRGCENIDALEQRVATGRLLRSDRPLLGLIELAGLELKELVNADRTQELKNRLQGAGNHLTRQILKYWSQNKHLRLAFDVRPARAGDPEGMRSGTNIWAEVVDQKHYVNTPLGSRSRGFVWFFSFLAWYSLLKTTAAQRVILLLDEPGLSLHANAQEDLLRYFEQELKGAHQLLYSTHSPFMVDPGHFERVRIVEDKTIDSDDVLPAGDEGTKVVVDVLDAGPDSLFPLQGALGYEISRRLFIGSSNLVVEGVADLLYMQALSSMLAGSGRTELSPGWTVTPVGGSDRVPTFVALAGVAAREGLRMATLMNVAVGGEQVPAESPKAKLLARNQVLTYAQFTGRVESDVEDMFEPDFYVDLVNEEYRRQLARPIRMTDLNLERPRIRASIAEYLAANPLKAGEFNPYRPARYFTENTVTLTRKVSPGTLDRFEKAFKALNALLV